MENYTIKEFFGYLFLTGFIIWITYMIFDGFGIFKDFFYTSNRRRR